MYDVFISYSTRGATTEDWLIKFTDELAKYYYLNYSKKLRIWIAIRENNVGDNFQDKIFEAIEKSLVFLMILDPGYIQSPEAIKEVEKYEEIRTLSKEPRNYISVIKWRGNKESELKSLVDSNLIVSYFSDFNKENNEEEYDDKSNEYKNKIQNIAKAIRTRELEESRKINSQKIFNILEQLNGATKIYVALGNTVLKNSRSQLVNQLTKTLERSEKVKGVKVLPDYLTAASPGNSLTKDDLTELFYDENYYGAKCLEALLNASSFAIVPFLSDRTNEAEDLFAKMQFQLLSIKSKSKQNKLPVTILSDIPKELYELPKFSDMLDNSQYENMSVIKEVDIGRFIDSYIAELVARVSKDVVLPTEREKCIYIVEYYINNTESTKQPDEEALKELELEKEHRRNFKKYIVNKNYVLLPSIRPNASLLDAIAYQKYSLNVCDGIIIYRGIREDPFWCIQQQSETYNLILGLNEEKKKKFARAVYVDPLQEIRKPEEYFYYKYDVILDFPKELDDFLCKIQ